MFNSNNRDKQTELFADLPEQSKKPKKTRFSLARISLSLSYENIFIVSIGLIMLLIVCYSLGVEKGKQLTQLKDADFEIGGKQQQETPATETPKPKQKKVRIKVAKARPISHTAPYIQVATFRTDQNANKEKQRLEDKGYRSFVVARGKYKEVRVGGYQNKAEALKDLRELKQAYSDCFIRSK